MIPTPHHSCQRQLDNANWTIAAATVTIRRVFVAG
jgi:hypothetical protein